MASHGEPLTTRAKPPTLKQRDQGKWFSEIQKKERPRVRRSRRISGCLETAEPKTCELSKASSALDESHNRVLPLPSISQKRNREADPQVNSIPKGRPHKRFRSLRARPHTRQTRDLDVMSGTSASQISHIREWTKNSNWPKEFFEQDKMERLLARKKPSTASLRRKRSEASLVTSATPSDLQAEKSSPYNNPSYETVLERDAGSYMSIYKRGVNESSEKLCKMLLDNKQPIPKDTIFDDNAFDDACERLRGKNEARIFKDCTPLIVPWAEAHALLSADRNLDIAIESVNEGWNNSNPITKPRPQPDYAIGFRRSAFSDAQLEKLQPFLGEPSDFSYFMGTYYMHFPFFACEVKCGSSGLDTADRQNLHSMTLAVRAVVELFQLSNRVQELDREILGFSISHNHEAVRIYGHFPVIEGTKVTYWRHSVRKYDFAERKGTEKWTAYTFMKNVYDTWLLKHFKRITSAIDDLPCRPSLEVPDWSEQRVSESSGLSQQLEYQYLEEEVHASHVRRAELQQVTPDRSAQTEAPLSKKKRGKA